MSFNFEADIECVEVNLVLLNGQIKENYFVCTKGNVLEEKNRILDDNKITYPPEHDLKLVVVAQNGAEQEMEEAKEMDEYISALTGSHLEIRRRNTPTRSSGYSENPSSLGYQIK